MSSNAQAKPAPVAIIGMACQLPPDIESPKSLWEFCVQARCSATPIPTSRYKASNFYHPSALKQGHFNVGAGSYISRDVSCFDAPYFHLTEAEATAMDPQHRLLLETTVHAIEDAGLDMNALSGRCDIGVFVASSNSEYETRLYQDPYTAGRYAAVGTASAMFANRISYFFNFQGPSITVDTACSSALTALHFAVESIRKGECSCALVGGSFLQLSPSLLAFMGNIGALSKDGTSYSFDSRANGYGRGDGVCCIVLKSELEARRCLDTVHALIRQTGINHGGRSQGGITVPNGVAQLSLLRQVYSSAGLRPEDTQFVEGHGTGTGRGDPVEANSIIAAFTGPARNGRPLFLGSVKSNFGHLENASGLLSVIKCVLMLQNRKLLPNANFQSLNSGIETHGCVLVVPTECIPWPEGVRRASISNFGFGGSNGHVILEEYTQISALNGSITTDLCNGTTSAAHLFVVSAKDPTALSSAITNLVQYVESNEASLEEDFLGRLSYTLCCRRTVYDHRFAFAASSLDQVRDSLLAANPSGRRTKLHLSIFAFTGQGTVWPEMGCLLMQYPEFAGRMKDADVFLRQELGASWSLLDELARPSETSRIYDSNISQPAVTALQIAMVSMLGSWGIEPTAVCGHSSGEIAAAYAAGLVDFKGSLALAYHRGAITALDIEDVRPRKGAMIAVGASASQVEPVIRSLGSGLASIACYNSAQSVTVSGDTCAVLELEEELNRLSIFNRRLKVDVAYHSDHMVHVAGRYLEDITPWLDKSKLAKSKGDCKFYSSVTGYEVSAGVVQSPWYWATNLVCPVKFHEAMRSLVRALSGPNASTDATHALLEVGPHGALAGPIRDILKEADGSAIQYMSTMQRSTQPRYHLLSIMSSLASLGFPVDVAQVNRSGDNSEPRMISNLPNYPFNRSMRYWHQTRLIDSYEHDGSPWNVILGHKTPSIGGTSEYRNVFTLDDIPWLRDHVVNGNVIFPLAGYISMAVEGLALEYSSISPGDVFRLRELTVGKALLLAEEVQHETYTILRGASMATRPAGSGSWYTFEVWSWTKGANSTEHCKGMIALQRAESNTVGSIVERKKEAMRLLRCEIESRSHRPVAASALYRQAALAGLTYGPAFSLLTNLATGPDVAVGSVKPADTARLMPEQYENKLIIHPTLLDATLHAELGLLSIHAGKLAGLRAHVPTFVEDMSISADVLGPEKPGHLRAFLHSAKTDGMARSTTIDACCFAEHSDLPVIEMNTLRMADVSEKTITVSDIDIINPAELQWLDHLDFITSDILERLDLRDQNTKAADEQRVQEIERLSLLYLRDALQGTSDSVAVMPHLELMKEWMEAKVAAAQPLLLRIPEPSVLPCSGPEGSVNPSNAQAMPWSDERFIHGVGSSLPSVLSGEVDALSVLDANGLQRVYEECFGFQKSAALLAQFIGKLSLQNPCMRILEVGAGTGGFTKRVLEQLSTTEPSRFSLYCYSDISPVFFEPARLRFPQWEHKMVFRTLDLGKEGAAQGFQASDFDLVIAADVVHATPSVNETLSTLRWLLKPHGVLAMVELSRFSPFCFPWAMLPGWWMRLTGPILSEEEWNEKLVEAGFSGVDAYVKDVPNGHDLHCTICSHVPPDPSKLSASVVVLGDDSLAHYVANSQHSRGCIQTEETCGDDQEVDIAVLVERDVHLGVTNLDDPKLSTLQKLCSRSKGILWIVRCSGDDMVGALAEFVFGVARTLRKEYTQLKLVVLHIVDAGNGDGAGDAARRYSEAVLKDAFWRGDAAMQATMGSIGLFDTVHFEPCVSLGPGDSDSLGDDEVLMQVQATGLNFKDVLIALGRVPWTGLGKECSGTVLATGRRAAHHLRSGDRIVHWGDGLFASHARSHFRTIVKVPDGLSLDFTQLASIPIVFATAYEALVKCARLQPGERLLIHAAAGGVGQAAIQLAQWIGCLDIYCTVGSPEKRDMLVEHYGIDPSHIFSSRSAAELADGLRLAGCMDVVLNSLSGEMLRESWRSLAPFGRFVELGKRDALANSMLEMAPLDRAVSYSAVDLVQPVMTMPISHLRSGLRLLQSGKHKGKVVMTNDADIRVEASNINVGAESTIVSARASYLITGGTGGLGKALAAWLITQGAKYITLTSRAGKILDAADATDLESLALARNAKVLVRKCDVSLPADLRDAIDDVAAQDMPPVRGVIHGAMVLKDSLFESYKPEDWKTVTQPKVAGVVNLHNAFPKADDLDFFVCLSSIASLSGNIGQAAYSGSNAAVDAFCNWRGRQGLPATSINLPAISNHGYVAEAVMAHGSQINDRIYRAAITMAHLEASVSAVLQVSGSRNQVIVGLSKTHEGRAWLVDAGILFELMRWDQADRDRGNQAQECPRSGEIPARNLIALGADAEAKRSIIQEALVKKISSMLMVSSDDVQLEKSVTDLGLDSLVAVELRNWIVRELDANLPVMDIVTSLSEVHPVLLSPLNRMSLACLLACFHITPNFSESSMNTLGVVYWFDCHYEVKGQVPAMSYLEGILGTSIVPTIILRPSSAYAVDDLFERLKDQFNKLQFYPVGSGRAQGI
ncbi:hypothetical protein M409DRAFT_58464 [Zasmidium cellare ATCC 36951]|uniref:Uncharacterized protein n=1 Tax=Zasmidium cellare ATCC 36951 TaxID=1080233 RepID=A0A6A6C819_ZASCE|nr:uncharacterized protein M409DRAFT_58464 [Zasmidium cellare ATCC 36951]KAF2162370.1 hypothetical protein M409DRAFT_58464 [Zasmidium cellare ATCC 36951]